jgi:hypothetical protein
MPISQIALARFLTSSEIVLLLKRKLGSEKKKIPKKLLLFTAPSIPNCRSFW